MELKTRLSIGDGFTISSYFKYQDRLSLNNTSTYKWKDFGGQNPINANREIIGKGDIQTQTEQVMQNIETALTACGASFENVVKLSIYIVQGQNLYGAFQASQKFMSNTANPPAISVLIVSGLANPNFLIEVDATAFVPE